MGTPIMQLLTSTNHQPEVWNTVAYNICLIDQDGLEHRISAYKIEQFPGDMEPVLITDAITNLFGGAYDVTEIGRPYGQVDILIGIHHAHLHMVVTYLECQRVGGTKLKF